MVVVIKVTEKRRKKKVTAHTERGWGYKLILCVLIGWIGPATHTPRVPMQ